MSGKVVLALAASAVVLAVASSASVAADPATITASPSSSPSSPLVLTAGDGTGVTVTFSNGDKTKSTSVLAAALTGSGYSKAADSCSGIALGPRKSCSVRVAYPGPAPMTQQGGILTVGAKNGPPSATAYFTVLGAAADLAITKSVDNATPHVGDQVAFRLTLRNNGPGAATGVRAVDVLPAGLTFVSATPSQGTYNSATGVWNVGSLGSAATATSAITAQVDAVTARTNTATVSADQVDPASANNSASATVTPQPAADLAIAKSVDKATPNRGDQVTFTLTLTNNGPSQATGVTVMDPLPAGLTFASASPSQGTYNSATGMWSVGSLGSGASATSTITARVDADATQTNIATVAADQFDPNSGNNSASVTVTPQPAADLAIASSIDNATPNVGDPITLTLTVANNGPSAATNVRATDQLPYTLIFVSATPSQGTYNPVTAAWAVGSLAAGASATLTIVANVGLPDPVTWIVGCSSDQFDANNADNTASQSLTPQRGEADLAITQTVDNPSPSRGDQITYTLTVTNNGPGKASRVEGFLSLRDGLTFVSANASQGTYDPSTGAWRVTGLFPVGSPLPPGGSATLQVTMTFDSRDPVSTQASTRSDQLDPNLLNNTTFLTVTPLGADLAITQTVDNSAPSRGDQITYTLTLTNNGPAAATRVRGYLSPRDGLTFVSASPSQGSFDASTGIWTVTGPSPSFASGASATLTVTMTFDSRDPVSTQASAASDDQFDPNLLNNNVFLTVTPLGADLAITQTVDNPTPAQGAQITYTLTLTNNGPLAATRVRGYLSPRDGLTFVSASPSQGSFDPSTGIWTVTGPSPAFASGASATLTVTVTFDSQDPVSTQASAASDDQFDPNVLNNNAFLTVTPQPPAPTNTSPTVVVTTPVEGGTFTFGEDIPFTVTVSDAEDGAINCSEVQVTFVLGHDAHGHAEGSTTGCSGVLHTNATDALHGSVVFGVVSATYTDHGNPGDHLDQLTATTQALIRQKHQEVEFVINQSGTSTATNVDGGAGVHRTSLAAGDWIQLNGPFNLLNIDSITYRVADATAGRTAGSPLGAIEIRQDSVTGPIVQTNTFTSTGGTAVWSSQTFPLSLAGTHELFLVFRAVTGGATGANLFNLNWIQFQGAGVGVPPGP